MSYYEGVIGLVRSFWIWGASSALIVFWTPLMAVVRLCDADAQHRRTARWFRRLGVALAKLNPWRIHISGVEHVDPREAYVVVSNHQSLADIPVLSHLRIDTKWMAKAELFRLPLLGWMLRMAGDVPVDRSDRRKGAMALKHCAAYLREGVSIVCFPEGTRSPNGEVLPFTQGPFQLAIRENRAVLPVVVDGSGQALPKGRWQFCGTRDIFLRVLDAVPVTGWEASQSGALRDAVRQRIVEELGKMRQIDATERLHWQDAASH
jgi:1-acyl-sn-glycerol-3-phosphate acyltransferase